ncbi:MAG TPA: hypothetical protein VHD36_19195 [Pirellulales bacterium]|nr:hypothetical protein [Pirellulales bacterium]
MENHSQIPPPPPPRPSERGRFSTRTLFFGVAVTALLLSLIKAGAFFVIVGVVSAILVAMGVAISISRLSALFAGVACITSVIIILCLGIGMAQRKFDVRSSLTRMLGETYGTKQTVDLVLLWLCAVGLSAILGAVLGWIIAKAEERG